MLHLTKDEVEFGRFTLEPLATNLKLIELKNLGVDMESAIYHDFKNFIPSINRLLCVRHLKQTDEKKLDKLLNRLKQNAASHQQAKFNILQVIYGCRTGGFYEFGLTDAFNKENFELKLTSWQEKWNSLCPDFFSWFKKKRSDSFVEGVIQSAREGSDVCGLYYQNDVEPLHHVEKMNQNFEKKAVKETIGSIQKLSYRQDSEEVRTIYVAGSYVLSAAYMHFFVPSATWHNWTVERKKDHVQKFRNYKPNVSDNFKKPKNAGRKPNNAKRIRTSPDRDIVMDRLEEVSASTNNSSSQPLVIAEMSQNVKKISVSTWRYCKK